MFWCPAAAVNLPETFAAVKVTKHANTLHNALAHPSVHFSLSCSKVNAYVFSVLLLSTAPAMEAYLKQGILIQDTLAQATLCSCCKELLRKGNPFPCCNGFCLEAKRESNCETEQSAQLSCEVSSRFRCILTAVVQLAEAGWTNLH